MAAQHFAQGGGGGHSEQQGMRTGICILFFLSWDMKVISGLDSLPLDRLQFGLAWIWIRLCQTWNVFARSDLGWDELGLDLAWSSSALDLAWPWAGLVQLELSCP